MSIIIAVLITLYICIGVMVYILCKLLGSINDSVGIAFGWGTRKIPLHHKIIDFIITVFFWPIILVMSR